MTVLAEQALVPRQRLLLKAGSRTVRALVESIDSRLDVDTLRGRTRASTGSASTTSARCGSAWPSRSRSTPTTRSAPPGAFLLIDDQTGATVAAGMVRTTAA